MALLVVGRRGELDDADVAGVERRDQPLDRAALAGGVPALEDDADRRPELAARRSGRRGSAAAGSAAPRRASSARAPPPCDERLATDRARRGAHRRSLAVTGVAAATSIGRWRGLGGQVERQREEQGAEEDQDDPDGDEPACSAQVAEDADREAAASGDVGAGVWGRASERQGEVEHRAGIYHRRQMPDRAPVGRRGQGGAGQVGYLADEPAALVSFLAQRLGKPVLVEGPAGVGKTELAKALSRATGRELIRLQCYEGLDEAKALYEWNYRKQLLRIQAGRRGRLGASVQERHLQRGVPARRGR